MNFDELMAVWRSQDAAPLHGFNEAILRLALRQEEAKLLAQRRRERWYEYSGGAFCFALTALFIAIMIYRNEGDGVTSWDYAIPIVVAAVALISGRAMYVRHRAQALCEQKFGESLRDQIKRQISQLDFWATRVRRARVLGEVLLSVVVFPALVFAWWRINDKPFSAAELIPISVGLCACITWLAVSFWRSRRRLQLEVLPRKRWLKALLKQLDDQE